MILRRPWLLCTLAALALPATAHTQTPTSPAKPEELVFEAETVSEPKEAWLLDRRDPHKWCLRTTEGPGKRSNNSALVSPKIEADRTRDEEGAPVLHTTLRNIPKGVYRVFLGPTTRPLGYSLDKGKSWQPSIPRGTELCIRSIEDGQFELWIDDRFADKANPGPAYYDTIRVVRYEPARIDRATAFTLPDGSTQISWITDQPSPISSVRCDGRSFPESEGELRNHRIFLTGLNPGREYTAQIELPGAAPHPLRFIAGARPQIAATRPGTVALTLIDPSGQPRHDWPVTAGIPIARATLANAEHARLTTGDGTALPAQFHAISHWPDGSVRWLQVSACLDTTPTPRPLQLRLGHEQPPPPTHPHPVLAKGEGDEIVTLDNGQIGLRIDRKHFALFDTVTLEGRPVTAPPISGNARIVDADGKAFGAGPADTLTIEESGPLRAVVRAEGAFVAEDGTRLFHWIARYQLHAGQRCIRLHWTIGNDRITETLTELRSAAVRIPILHDNPLHGAIGSGAEHAIEQDDTTWLLQDHDDHFTQSDPGSQHKEGEHAHGIASASNGSHRLTAVVRNFWQTYPKGVALKQDGIHVRILPELPADIYRRESENTEDLIRLYYCYAEGRYRVKRGLEFTTELLLFADRATSAECEPNLVPWADAPPILAATPEEACKSLALGTLEPRAQGRFEEYEQLAERGFEQIEKNRREKHEYGWMNFGDWHGERHYNWGNLEYDMAYALALQFVRTGDPKWLERAEQAARHSTDIDTIHTPWDQRMSGRVYTHSIGHVGGFFDPQDPTFRARGNIFGLRDLSASNPFVSGAIDSGGHVQEPGILLVGLLLGEQRLREIGEMVCAAQASYLTPNFRFGIERAAGWPLLNAIAAQDATANPFFSNAIHLYLEKIVATQTERGDWNLPYGPPECLHEPRHTGGKAFATGILLHALTMCHSLEPSPALETCIKRSAHWLVEHSWNRETHQFRYIDSCPKYERGSGNGPTDFLVSSGLARACTLDPDPALREVLLDSLGHGLRASVGLGKDTIMNIRQTPFTLAILHREFGLDTIPMPAPAPARKR